LETKRNRAMNLRDIVLNYLTDNEKGMQQLITWFLNDVMNEEVAQQAGVPKHARSEFEESLSEWLPVQIP
jgi:hypothetical protein